VNSPEALPQRNTELVIEGGGAEPASPETLRVVHMEWGAAQPALAKLNVKQG
jgi:hypothetical protein